MPKGVSLPVAPLAEGVTKVYSPTPTQARAMYSDKTFRVLVGPRGEGKTVCALMTLVVYAQERPPSRWPIKIALVRDTRRNLGITTAETIKEWLPVGRQSFWAGKEKEPEYCVIKFDGVPVLEFYFFGCDSPQDLSRFQSFECDGLWIEEPAPAADISGGVGVDVMLAGTSMRRSGDPIVVVSLNPPDEDHWTAYFWQLPGYSEPDWTAEEQAAAAWIRERSEVCILPPGENVHLTAKDPEYRERNLQMLTLAGRQDLVNRLVHGLVGNVQVGEPVTPEFGPQFLVEDVPNVKPGDRLLMSWDPQANPACVLWRPLSGVYCDVLATWQGLNMGVQQLIELLIKPWLALHVPPRYHLVHTGDPNMLKPDQSNSNVSATKVIVNLLGAQQWVSGPSSVDDRRLPLHSVLNRYQHGRPWVRVWRPHCRILVKALSGGWHYRKDASGRVVTREWVKNADSDVGEAFAYGCAYLYNKHDATSAMDTTRKRMSQRARDHRSDAL